MFDGVQSTPISHNRVSKWFESNAAPDAMTSIRSAIDRKNRLVIWAFKTSSSEPINNRLIIYNWGADKWSYAEVDTQVIDEYVSPGFSLDALDGPLPAGIDTDSIPVDSSLYAGGTVNLQAFDSSNQAATFDGAPLTSVIDTTELAGPNHSRLMTNSVRPLVEGPPTAAVTVEVGTRNGLRDNVMFSTPRSLNGLNGEANIRVNSRYQRYRLNITGGFDHGVGVKTNSRISGGRR